MKRTNDDFKIEIIYGILLGISVTLIYIFIFNAFDSDLEKRQARRLLLDTICIKEGYEGLYDYKCVQQTVYRLECKYICSDGKQLFILD